MPSQHALFPPLWLLQLAELAVFLSEAVHAEVEVILVKPLPQLEKTLMHLAVLPPVGLHHAPDALVRQSLQVLQLLRESMEQPKILPPVM